VAVAAEPLAGHWKTASLLTFSVAAVLGDWIGALTLTGSAVAFAKLHGIMTSAPLSLPGGLQTSGQQQQGGAHVVHVHMGLA
jgi:NAD/NADP transhydrogenase beta subunit